MKANPRANSRAGYHRFGRRVSEQYGSFELFWDDQDFPVHGGRAPEDARNYDSNGEPVQPGWYWWACFPGCLPDGEATGPFATSTEAYEDAKND